MLTLKKPRHKTRRKISLKSPTRDRLNRPARNQRAREEGEKKSEFALGTKIIEVTADRGAARDDAAMTSSHSQR